MRDTLKPSAFRLALAALATTALAAAGALSNAACGGGASCESVCNNVIDKCLVSGLEDTSVAKNNCIEQCNQRLQNVKASCVQQRDDLLKCVAGAKSVDCSDPQRTAECSSQNKALSSCSGATVSTTSGATSGGATSGGPPDCFTDSACTPQICLEKINQCGMPQGPGGPCIRDSECAAGLCLENENQCGDAQPLGGGCIRDEECQNGLCNERQNQCANAAAAGQPCLRNQECVSNVCNGQTCG